MHIITSDRRDARLRRFLRLSSLFAIIITTLSADLYVVTWTPPGACSELIRRPTALPASALHSFCAVTTIVFYTTVVVPDNNFFYSIIPSQSESGRVNNIIDTLLTKFFVYRQIEYYLYLRVYFQLAVFRAFARQNQRVTIYKRMTRNVHLIYIY